MRSYIPKALLVALMAIISFSASAQRFGRHSFNIKHYTEATPFWQRSYVIITYPMTNANLEYKYEGRDYYGKKVSENYSKKMPAKGSGLGFGCFFRLAKLNEKSRLCLSTDFMMNVSDWVVEEVGKVNVSAFGVFVKTETVTESVVSMGEMAFPITLDFKTGCDAMQTKKLRGCFAFGVGAYTSWATTDFYGIQESKWSVRPAVKFEAGVRWGMCFKIRALAQLGRLNYMQLKDEDAGYNENISITGKGNLLLSLLITPTAFSWDREESY